MPDPSQVCHVPELQSKGRAKKSGGGGVVVLPDSCQRQTSHFLFKLGPNANSFPVKDGRKPNPSMIMPIVWGAALLPRYFNPPCLRSCKRG